MTDKTPARTATEIHESIFAALMERHGLSLEGEEVNGLRIGVKIRPETSTMGFRTVRTGKMRVSIGDHWAYMGMFKTKSYPQLKSGKHSYNKIADEWARMYEIVNQRNAAKAKLKAKSTVNEDTIKAVTEELGVVDTKLSVNSRTGCLVFKIFDVKPYDAIEFAALAKQLGYLTEK